MLMVFASQKPSLRSTAEQSMNVIMPNIPAKYVSAIEVGLPPQLSASNSYNTATSEALKIVKGILGDELSAYLNAGSSTTGVLQNQGSEQQGGGAGFFLQSETSAGHSIFYRVSGEPPPETGAKVALVADLGSGEVFYGLNLARRWPLASITKLMTAEIVTKSGLLNQSTTITEAEFTIDGSTGDLKVGESYTLADLRTAMLVESNNEAAEALADSYGYDNFIRAMNAEAQNWGLNDTHFSDPVGLSAANQSTANDLLVFTRHIFSQYPEIFAMTRKTSASIRELNSKSRITVKNIDDFAGRADFLGGKTGYTDDASGNLLSVFSYEKKPILIIVMGTEDRFGDSQKFLDWFERNYK